MNFKKESRSTLIILIIVITSLIIMIFLSMGIKYTNVLNSYNWIFYFVGYIVLLILFGWIYEKYPNKFLKYVNLVISYPPQILLLIFQFSVPTIGMILHIILFVFYSFIIPIILIEINQHYSYVQLTDQTTIFIYI